MVVGDFFIEIDIFVIGVGSGGYVVVICVV